MVTCEEKVLRHPAGGRPEVRSALSDDEAERIVRSLTRKTEFVENLLANVRQYRGRLNQGTQYWLHKVAQDAQRPREERQPEVRLDQNIARLMVMFRRAQGKGLKRPHIKVVHPVPGKDGEFHLVDLAMAPDSGTNPGHIYVKDGVNDVYYGKIAPDGGWHGARTAPRDLVEFLQRFAEDPAKHARAHARLAGFCCFCSRPLEDERSSRMGYGPICAKHYDLPWGTEATIIEEELQ